MYLNALWSRLEKPAARDHPAVAGELRLQGLLELAKKHRDPVLELGLGHACAIRRATRARHLRMISSRCSFRNALDMLASCATGMRRALNAHALELRWRRARTPRFRRTPSRTESAWNYVGSLDGIRTVTVVP